MHEYKYNTNYTYPIQNILLLLSPNQLNKHWDPKHIVFVFLFKKAKSSYVRTISDYMESEVVLIHEDFTFPSFFLRKH